MADTVIVNTDDASDDDTVVETDEASSETVVNELVDEAIDRVDDVVDVLAEVAAEEAVDEAVEEIVEEAAAIITEAQFAALHSRIDNLEHEMQTLRELATTPQEIVVVPPEEVIEELSDDGMVPPDTDDGDTTDAGISDDSADVAPVVEDDETPNRKLGWRAYVLGGSGGTRGRSRR
ncbi:MAG: hypothetical protein AB7I44_21105 [Hyphomicrobiaceae bacterium]